MTSAASADPRRGLWLLFAVAGGLAVANISFADPLLVTIAGEFAMDPAITGLVVTATQVGYGIGLILIVPLGDLIDRRRLIVGLMGASAVAAVWLRAGIVGEARGGPELWSLKVRGPFVNEGERGVTDALAGAADYASRSVGATHVVVFTQSGFTARLMSKFRPVAPIIALTPTAEVARRINLLWGATPFVLSDPGEYHEHVVERVDSFLLEHDIAQPGDHIVILMGSPLFQQAKTNVLRVHRISQP